MAKWPYRRKKRRLVLAYFLLSAAVLIALPCIVHFFAPGDSSMKITDDYTIRLWDHEREKLIEIGLEKYVIGVVAAEMPASFHLEALKAQAIAARTYVVKRLQVADPRVKKIHPQADVSSDHTINQAWISNEEMLRRWGKLNYKKHLEKITTAVWETRGIVLVYEGELIDPVYHASCGGKGTENSEDVWSYKVPYLRSVPCSEHNETQIITTATFSWNELDRRLATELSTLPAAKLNNRGIVDLKDKTAGGKVNTISLGGKTFSGAEVRAKLDLRSSKFEALRLNNGIKFTVFGYGHGVGMCQHGATALAEQGKKSEEILKHYYTGVKLARVKY